MISSVKCYFENNGDSLGPLRTADAIFYAGTGKLSKFYDPKKINLFFKSESDALYPGKTNSFLKAYSTFKSNTFIAQLKEYQTVGDKFDISVSYHLESDPVIKKLKDQGKKFIHVPFTYSPYITKDYFKPPIPFKKKNKNAIAAIFMSNCGKSNSNRNEIFEQIMQLTEIHSFGKCNRYPIISNFFESFSKFEFAIYQIFMIYFQRNTLQLYSRILDY